MDIRNTCQLKQTAARRVADAAQEKQILLFYCGATMGLAFLTVVIRYALGLQIDQMGGLSNLSTRTMLSTVQSVLPLVQALVVMCVELGYVAAMLRIARGQYASPNTLRLGFDRFWTLLRCCVIQGLIYGGMIITSVYAAAMLFVASPLGENFMAQMAPFMAEVSMLNPQIAITEAEAAAMIPSMIPMFVLVAVALLFLLVPTMYRFRMANYVIIDKPGRGAMFALRESRKMMRGNCLKLLKLDLSYWWYYLLFFVITCVGNLDLYLSSFGVTLPISADAAYFIFYAIYLLLQFAAYYFLRNRLETTYALVYDAIKPEEPQQNSVVLGNIFQM